MFPFFTEQAKAKGMILFFSKFFSSVFECQEVNPVAALVSRPTKIVKTHFTIMATAVVAIQGHPWQSVHKVNKNRIVTFTNTCYYSENQVCGGVTIRVL